MNPRQAMPSSPTLLRQFPPPPLSADQAVARVLRAEMEEQKVSAALLSRLTSISAEKISNLLRGRSSFKLRETVLLSTALFSDGLVLLRRAGDETRASR